MHAIFIPYGIKQNIDQFQKFLETQMYKIPFTKGLEKQEVLMQGNLRILPFGIWDYVFTREHMDLVLTTLNFHKVGKIIKGEYEDRKDRYDLGFLRLAILRKLVKCEPIPEFQDKGRYPWLMDSVEIIPIGIRHDADRTEPEGTIYAGWTHEAI